MLFVRFIFVVCAMLLMMEEVTSVPLQNTGLIHITKRSVEHSENKPQKPQGKKNKKRKKRPALYLKR